MTGHASSLSSHLAPVVAAWSSSPAVRRVLEARRERLPFVDVAASPGARSFVMATLAADEPRSERVKPPILLVTATTREADDLAEALSAACSRATRSPTFPSWETLPHERLSPRSDTVGRGSPCSAGWRTRTRTTPHTGRCRVVVAPVRAVLQPVARGLGELAPVALRRRRRGPARGRRRRARRGRLHADRPGRAAR